MIASTILWPATIFATSLTARAKGLVSLPMASTGTIIKRMTGCMILGTPGGRKKTVFAYPAMPKDLIPEISTTIKPMIAKAEVTETLAVGVIPRGVRPI